MSNLRIGVVGAGRLGGFHAQKLVALPGVELVGVADPIETSRNRLAAQCHTQAIADYRALVDQIDAVVVATPTTLHHEIGCEFLSKGKHVLMEKPLALNTREADEMVDLAHRHSVVLQVGHVERFNPAFTAILPHVRGAKYIEAVRASGFSFRSTDIGVVLDLMIHDIDLLLTLSPSPVRRVDALGLSILGGHEDVANARIEFEDGGVATLSASRVSYTAARTMQVWGQRAFAAVDFATRQASLIAPSMRLLQRGFDVAALSPEQVEHYKQHLFEDHLPRTEMNFEAVDALTLELEDFANAIRTGRPPRVTGRQGREAVAVAEAILRGIAGHAWDGVSEGRIGPMAVPQRPVVPAPHFEHAPAFRRAAG